jgi:hypothetical protein
LEIFRVDYVDGVTCADASSECKHEGVREASREDKIRGGAKGSGSCLYVLSATGGHVVPSSRVVTARLVLLVLARDEDIDCDSSIKPDSGRVHHVANQDTDSIAGGVAIRVLLELDGEIGRNGRVGQVVAEVQQADDAGGRDFSTSRPLSAVQVAISVIAHSHSLQVVREHLVQ